MTKHQTLVLTEAAVEHITRRLLFALNRSVKRLKEEKIYSVADPGYGIRCFFDPWIRDPGGVNEQPGSYFRELKKQIFGL
jgi:hypothetical protein